jgi:hypothetical protein
MYNFYLAIKNKWKNKEWGTQLGLAVILGW